MVEQRIPNPLVGVRFLGGVQRPEVTVSRAGLGEVMRSDGQLYPAETKSIVLSGARTLGLVTQR